MLFNPDEEGVELEVKRARRKTHIHCREDLHARPGEAFGLSQKREEKQLSICTAATVGQHTQHVEVEANTLRRDQLLSLLRRALTVFIAARLGQSENCSL